MYAVIETGGKQYRVSQGQSLKIETLPVASGETVTFDKVLMIANEDNHTFGTPYINGGQVLATVVKEGRHDKIKIVKMRRRKHYRRQMGHRQNYIEVKIEQIQG